MGKFYFISDCGHKEDFKKFELFSHAMVFKQAGILLRTIVHACNLQ